ncbi:hypothetical protein Tco_0958795 [Tanacetum coccineum]
MKKGVDVISAYTKTLVTTLESPHMSKIPAHLDAHPFIAGMLAGASRSGHVYIRTREESHYSESKTPTARTEPRRRHGDRHGHEGGVFNRLGRKEPATSARSDSRQRSPQAKRTEVEARRRQQKGTPSGTTSNIQRVKIVKGVTGNLNQEGHRSSTYEDDLSQPWTLSEIAGRMYWIDSSFLQGEVVALSHGRRKASLSWKPSEGGGGDKPNFKKGFKNKQRPDRKPDRFSLLTKLPKEIFALEKGKVQSPTPMVTIQHNAIIGRPGIRKIRAVPSTAHGMLKFPVEGGTVTLQSSRVIPMECAMISGPSIQPPAVNQGYSPVRQKKRGQAPERNKVIQEEVEKLVDAGIMKEVHYHSWLSNPVMVKKHDGTWRMCVDFKDLNNACPKDCYPLMEIDWKVGPLWGFFKCFLDDTRVTQIKDGKRG